MESSIFLAQILGPIITVIGFSLILNKKFFKKILKEFKNQPHTLIYISGIMAMFFGIFMIIKLETTRYIYEYILLVFGYLATIKGAWLLLFPGTMKHSIKYIIPLTPTFPYIGVIYIILGVCLCIIGY